MYLILWKFVARPEHTKAFIAACKPDGDWARLFAQAPGYRGTDLLTSTTDPHTFITIDRWDSPNHYGQFKQQYAEPYSTLDAQLEGLTVSEVSLGSFNTAEH
jgi:heme-degrading monooxygenase HmoA